MELIVDKLLLIPAILIAIGIHEFSHAKTADLLGDSTPRSQGRLTLNPIAHIDWFGFFAFLLVGFGWGKPVLINPRAYRNYHKAQILVSIMGPLSNLVVAFFFSLICALVGRFANADSHFLANIRYILQTIVLLNCVLFIFNLFPIPPLDGFKVMRGVFPMRWNGIFDRIERQQFMILIGFILLVRFVPNGSAVILLPTQGLYSLFMNMSNSLVHGF